MAPRMRFAVFSLWLSFTAVGCGGSSSETPPPLEPDPTSARYTGPRVPKASDDVAPTSAAEPDEDDKPGQPQRPAAATWGGK
jgi:hypothetical protein